MERLSTRPTSRIDPVGVLFAGTILPKRIISRDKFSRRSVSQRRFVSAPGTEVRAVIGRGCLTLPGLRRCYFPCGFILPQVTHPRHLAPTASRQSIGHSSLRYPTYLDVRPSSAPVCHIPQRPHHSQDSSKVFPCVLLSYHPADRSVRIARFDIPISPLSALPGPANPGPYRAQQGPPQGYPTCRLPLTRHRPARGPGFRISSSFACPSKLVA